MCKKTLFCLKTRCFHVLPSFVQKRQNTCKIYISPWKHGILSHFVQKGEKRRKNRVFAKKIRFSQMLCSLLEKLLKASFTWFSIIFQQKLKKTTYNMHFCTLLWKRVLYDRDPNQLYSVNCKPCSIVFQVIESFQYFSYKRRKIYTFVPNDNRNNFKVYMRNLSIMFKNTRHFAFFHHLTISLGLRHY